MLKILKHAHLTLVTFNLQPVSVEVIPKQDEQLSCRTYILLKRGSKDRRPSPQYLDVIVRGAEEHNLPEDYVKQLQLIEHNGFPGPLPLYDRILSSLQ
jgi:gamma-glutamylcyclotransferase